MFLNRLDLYKELEREFDGKLILYVTSDRPNMSARIASDVIDLFVNHLDEIGNCHRIILYLYTRGGDTSAAWNIVNLIRMFGDELVVIVPYKAHSAGTIISLGANRIVMTKQATLSPIDPSITTPLNPMNPNTKELSPVSVEAVNGYLDYAREELQICDSEVLAQIFMKLTDSVQPLVLGEVYRSRAQIKMLAKRLLQNQELDDKEIQKIVEFLCSESGSHDYTLNRREAKALKLQVDNPSDSQYKIIKAIYDDVSRELKMREPFNYSEINGAFSERRSLLESINGGSDYFITEGSISHIKINNNDAVSTKIVFEGWRHDSSIPEQQTLTIGNEDKVLKYETGGDFQL